MHGSEAWGLDKDDGIDAPFVVVHRLEYGSLHGTANLEMRTFPGWWSVYKYTEAATSLLSCAIPLWRDGLVGTRQAARWGGSIKTGMICKGTATTGDRKAVSSITEDREREGAKGCIIFFHWYSGISSNEVPGNRRV